MSYMTAKAVAAEIKGCDEAQLHYKFVQYLSQIVCYATSLGGISRQTVATAIATWELVTGDSARSE